MCHIITQFLWCSILLLLNLQKINCQFFNLSIVSPEEQNSIIFNEGELIEHYNDLIYEQNLDCTNGGLEIIEFEQSEADELIIFRYNGMDITRKNIQIEVEPNIEPKPILKDINRVYKQFVIDASCPDIIQLHNYYNHVTVRIKNTLKYKSSKSPEYFTFSFLLNCDYMDVHKNFQYGYLLICIIGTLMVVFVSIHPRIFSLRIKNAPITLEINWKGFLLINAIILSCILASFAQKISPRQLHNLFGKRNQFEIRLRYAHSFLRHLGLLLSYFYVFVCLNEFFFEFKQFLKLIPFEGLHLGQNFVTKRMIFSFVISTIIYIIGLKSQNLIFYNVLACCISIGAIKMFRFNSLKNGVYSMSIIVATVAISSIWSHYKLPRSYNDFATQMSSPIFIQVPDLVNNLYKKCSWISVFDIVFPGAIMAYLRDYDENLHIKWHGVYTMTSIFSFILANTVWMFSEAITTISIPFCVITYPIFLISISLIALYRNEMETIWDGNFNLPNDQNIFELIKSKSSKKIAPKDIFDPLYHHSESCSSEAFFDKKSDLGQVKKHKQIQTPTNIKKDKREKNNSEIDFKQYKNRVSPESMRSNKFQYSRKISPQKRQLTPYFRNRGNTPKKKNQ